ncbi:MAG: hypothetical protein V7K24_25585 [Nostoc sp.]
MGSRQVEQLPFIIQNNFVRLEMNAQFEYFTNCILNSGFWILTEEEFRSQEPELNSERKSG